MLSKGAADAPLLVDVREVIEYHTYNIGGINIPLGRLDSMAPELLPNKNREIIVICKAGIRSRTAQQLLLQRGYTNVRNLSGGLLAMQKLK